MNFLLKLKYKVARLFVIVFLLLGVVSCRKDIPDVNNPANYQIHDFTAVFESFWTGVNNNYIFWDVDPTDWDAVYKEYKPLFAQLNFKNPTDHEKAYNYFVKMTENLVDSHLTVYSENWGNNGIYPSKLRHIKNGSFHEPIGANYFFNVLPNKYLNNGYKKSYELVPAFGGDNTEYLSVSGKIKNTNILYLRFSDFVLSSINKNIAPNSYAVLDYYFKELENSNLTGLIIDLRSNGGGFLNDMNILAGGLTDKPYVFGATHAKSGSNRLDYLPWAEAKVYPLNNTTKAFTKPIVVLADVQSISMAEMSTMALKSLPSAKVTFVGERTWGGLGQISPDMDIHNSGQFSNSYFKNVYCSTTALRYIDGKIYEGIGFPPDVEVKYNKASLDAGIDLQLEKAISLLPK